jgi:DNA-binding NarL/FixJ family response regulator
LANGIFNDEGRPLPKFRVLVVEDQEAFRRLTRSILAEMAELQIVGEAADGLEAVLKARELLPDLIVLDLGLPKLNGMEAARQIRKLSPNSKILVMSQESSPEVVQTAFSEGAKGYVVKVDAGRELLRAVKAILGGDLFVGVRFSGLSVALA